jgi:flagellar motor switch protein FliM
VVSPSEVVVVSTFHVDLEGGSGEFHVTMPYSMLEPMRDLLVSGFQPSEDEKDDRWMKIHVTIAESQLTLKDVMEFKAGDIIPVEIPEALELKYLRTSAASSSPRLIIRMAAFSRSVNSS